jgi:hypothetical protein
MQLADAEGFNVHRRQYRSIRFGEDVEVRRSPQAVACKKRCAVELGKPQRFQNIWAVKCSFKWLNRRGGKRKSFTWAVFSRAIARLGIAKPEMVIVDRQHRVFT